MIIFFLVELWLPKRQSTVYVILWVFTECAEWRMYVMKRYEQSYQFVGRCRFQSIDVSFVPSAKSDQNPWSLPLLTVSWGPWVVLDVFVSYSFLFSDFSWFQFLWDTDKAFYLFVRCPWIYCLPKRDGWWKNFQWYNRCNDQKQALSHNYSFRCFFSIVRDCHSTPLRGI